MIKFESGTFKVDFHNNMSTVDFFPLNLGRVNICLLRPNLFPESTTAFGQCSYVTDNKFYDRTMSCRSSLEEKMVDEIETDLQVYCFVLSAQFFNQHSLT